MDAPYYNGGPDHGKRVRRNNEPICDHPHIAIGRDGGCDRCHATPRQVVQDWRLASLKER